jgi:hypothetical protein
MCTVLRAVVADFFFNCWCLEIPSDNRMRPLSCAKLSIGSVITNIISAFHYFSAVAESRYIFRGIISRPCIRFCSHSADETPAYGNVRLLGHQLSVSQSRERSEPSFERRTETCSPLGDWVVPPFESFHRIPPPPPYTWQISGNGSGIYANIFCDVTWNCVIALQITDPSSRQRGHPTWKIKKVFVTQINVTFGQLLQKGQDTKNNWPTDRRP